MSEGQDEAVPRTDVAPGEVVAWAEEGRLVVTGPPAQVEEFVVGLKPERELDLAPFVALADGAGALVPQRAAGMAKRYLELSPRRWQEIAPGGGLQSELRLVTRNPVTGRFVSNTAVTVPPVVVPPQVLIALAAIEMAIQSVADAIEEIAKDVDDLKRIAETAEIGNLAGLYRVLANAREQVDRTGTISRTTWESVATHEVTAQQSADRLRALLRRTLEDLPLDADTGDRLDSARRLLSDGTVRRSLRLLVLAEQCRLLWRSLKLDQVRVAEPASLEAEAVAAKAMLAENAQVDRGLVEALRDGVAQLTRVTALDGIRLVSRTKLPAAGVDLRAQVDEFAAARAQQIDSWAPGPTFGIRDAAREAQVMAARAAVEGRRAVGGWIAGIGTRIQGAAEPLEQDHDQSPRSDD